jgi:hypothetical protein
MHETRHMQPGGSWFGLYRCSRGHRFSARSFAAATLRSSTLRAAIAARTFRSLRTSLEGLIRQITLYRATHSRVLLYTLTPRC